ISSQFHDECSAAPGRFFNDTRAVSIDVRMNLAFAPYTLMTGWRPIVLVTTPPQPASKARRMLVSDSVGGADESRKGFSKRIPVNVVPQSIVIASSRSGHPVGAVLLVPFRRHLLRPGPEFDRAAAGDVSHAKA